MIKEKFLLLIAVVVLMLSCSKEDGSKIPGIIREHVELSTAHPVAYSHFQKDDYPMYEFRLSYGKNDTEVLERITKDILSKEQSIVKLSNGENATFYCKNNELHKIDFDFMTISKVQSGKYEVQLTKKANQSVPKVISFGFIAPNGISSIVISFR